MAGQASFKRDEQVDDEMKELYAIFESMEPWRRELHERTGWNYEQIAALCAQAPNNPSVDLYLRMYKKDDDGKRQHEFRPKTGEIEGPDKACVICEDPPDLHGKYLTCTACYELVVPEKFYKLESCEENHNFCRDCWRMHMESLMEQGKVAQIKCMDYCCQARPTETEVMSLIPEKETQDKYKRYHAAYLVDTNKDLIMCPNGECGTVIKKTKGAIKCQQC
jgi:hypothetical protein